MSRTQKMPALVEPEPLRLKFSERRMQSFTSLAISIPSELMPPRDFEAKECSIHTLPAGSETGILLHAILEKMPSRDVDDLVRRHSSGTPYMRWSDVLHEVVSLAWTTPLNGFSLADVDPKKMRTEMEFLFGLGKSQHFAGKQVIQGEVSGVIDLFFEHEGRYYLLDWKSNWLGDERQDYTPEKLEGAMAQHDYFLQMELYLQALGRYLARVDPRPLSEVFGGIFYVFLRGLKDGSGVFFQKVSP